jgi:hypothetical protein
VDSERTISDTETKRDTGTSVKYGDECRLQHRVTGEFLSSHTLDGDDAGNTSTLEHHLSLALCLCHSVVTVSCYFPCLLYFSRYLSSGMPKMTTRPDNSVTFLIKSGFKADRSGHQVWTNQPFTLKSAVSRLHVGSAEELMQRDGSEGNPYELGHYRAVMQPEGCLLTAEVTPASALAFCPPVSH